MRAVQNPEMNLGQVAIEDIQFDARCRDDIPAVLKGIQYIYCNRELRERIFDLLEGAILALPRPARERARKVSIPTAAVPAWNYGIFWCSDC